MSLAAMGLITFATGGLLGSVFGFKWVVYTALLLTAAEAYKRATTDEEETTN